MGFHTRAEYQGTAARGVALEEVIFDYYSLPESGLYHPAYPVGEPVRAAPDNPNLIAQDEARRIKKSLAALPGGVRGVAQILGISPKTLRNYLDRGCGCPPERLERLRRMAA